MRGGGERAPGMPCSRRPRHDVPVSKLRQSRLRRAAQLQGGGERSARRRTSRTLSTRPRRQRSRCGAMRSRRCLRHYVRYQIAPEPAAQSAAAARRRRAERAQAYFPYAEHATSPTTQQMRCYAQPPASEALRPLPNRARAGCAECRSCKAEASGARGGVLPVRRARDLADNAADAVLCAAAGV